MNKKSKRQKRMDSVTDAMTKILEAYKKKYPNNPPVKMAKNKLLHFMRFIDVVIHEMTSTFSNPKDPRKVAIKDYAKIYEEFVEYDAEQIKACKALSQSDEDKAISYDYQMARNQAPTPQRILGFMLLNWLDLNIDRMVEEGTLKEVRTSKDRFNFKQKIETMFKDRDRGIAYRAIEIYASGIREVDHFKPWSLGGPTDTDNSTNLPKSDNRAYGDKDKKQCAKCKKILLKTEFHRDVTHSDGLKSSCKGCRNPMEKKTRDARKAKARGHYHQTELEIAGAA